MVYYLWKAYNLQIRQFMFFMFPPRYKKSVETYQLLAPHSEALGLPILSKRATMTPRRYARRYPTHREGYRNLHTHGRLSLLCSMTRLRVS